MKKFVIVCLILISFIPAFALAKEEVTGLTLGEAAKTHGLSVKIPDKEVEGLINQLILVPLENDYSHEEVVGMIYRISRIHPSILHQLADNDVKIKLFSGKLTDEPYFSDLKGVSPRGWNQNITWDEVPGAGGAEIVAAKIGASEKGHGHGSINLELHEIAHSVEYTIGNGLRENEEFLAIWRDEVSRLFNEKEYFNNYPEEYFAEVFAMFYLNEASRMEVFVKAPKTYAFIQKLENR